MKFLSKEFIRKKVIPYILGYSIKYALNAIIWTCKFHIEGEKKLFQAAKTSNCILIAWHNRIGIISQVLLRAAPQLRYAAMISKSRDGEIISVIVNSYKNARSIRVPHNAKSKALHSIITQLKLGKEVIFATPDGPRGPKYILKSGIAFAARKSNAKVIPITWSANRVWRFRSWDQLMLPKPFSTITVKMGDPIQMKKDHKNSLKEDVQTLQEALLAIQSPEN